MVLRRWSMFGVPLPRFLAPRIAAREWQEERSLPLRGRGRVPLIGRIIRYTGWLGPWPKPRGRAPDRRHVRCHQRSSDRSPTMLAADYRDAAAARRTAPRPRPSDRLPIEHRSTPNLATADASSRVEPEQVSARPARAMREREVALAALPDQLRPPRSARSGHRRRESTEQARRFVSDPRCNRLPRIRGRSRTDP